MGKKRLTDRTHWSEDETDLLLQLRAEGLSIAACADRLKRSYDSCQGRLRLLRRMESKLQDKKAILDDASESYKLAASKAWRLE